MITLLNVVQNNNMILKKTNILLILLMIISLSCLYGYSLFYKQIIWYFICFITLFLTKLNLKKVVNLSLYIYIFNLILLVLVLFVGKEINGSRAWINVGLISIQPSEFMKFSLIIYMAKLIKENKNNLILFTKLFLIFLVPSLLVFLEPDTGAIIFYFVIFLSCSVFSKIKRKYILIFLFFLSCSVFLIFILYFLKISFFVKIFGSSLFYRFDRLLLYQDSLQLNNALILISKAGFFGFGKNIPLNIIEGRTDFAFTTLITKFGLLGGLVLLLIYFLLLKKIIYQNKLFSYAFASILIFQIFYNIFMNIGLLPIMGIPLPFVSYGGSSLLVYFFIYEIYITKSYL